MVYYYLTAENLAFHKITLGKLCKEKENFKRLQIEAETAIDEEMEKLKKLKVKRDEMKTILEKVEKKVKEEKEIVENSVVLNVITVDDERDKEFLNGLVGLNRDILMKLLKMLNSEKTRMIIGMADIFYEWSKRSIFRWARGSLRIRIINKDKDLYDDIEVRRCETVADIKRKMLTSSSLSANFFSGALTFHEKILRDDDRVEDIGLATKSEGRPTLIYLKKKVIVRKLIRHVVKKSSTRLRHFLSEDDNEFI